MGLFLVFSLALHGIMVMISFPQPITPLPITPLTIPVNLIPHEEAPPPPLTIKEESNGGSTISKEKYTAYLLTVKRKIEKGWRKIVTSPNLSRERVSVIKFTIAADGHLITSEIVASSGIPSLDEMALRVVRNAAPFEPIPNQYRLKRLHIIASFHYEPIP
jgi:protein TonB